MGQRSPSNRARVKLAYFTLASSRTNGPTSRTTRVDAKVSDRTSSQGGISPYQTLFNHLERMAPPPLGPSQTRTSIHLAGHPQKSALVAEFAGNHLRELRTPALVIDRHVFSKNCARMHDNAAGYGAAFRAHLKTHKVTNRSGDSMSTIQCPVFIYFIRSLDCGRYKAPTCFLCCYHSCNRRIHADGGLGSCEIGTCV